MEKSTFNANVKKKVDPEQRLERHRKHQVQVGCAFACLSGSVVVSLLGAAFTVSSWVVGDKIPGPLLNKVGAVMFFLTIPLVLASGWFLDKFSMHTAKIAGSTGNSNEKVRSNNCIGNNTDHNGACAEHN